MTTFFEVDGWEDSTFH